ncbi:MAG: glycosyltransferase family 2 protein [Parcubacteria group bacterium]|nr:glycosyltransferase family 2 protein [Parcubacteria group bacterium]
MEFIFTFIFFIALFIILFFEVFLLVTYFENKKSFTRLRAIPSIGTNSTFPSVTIIVPCLNEGGTLSKTVGSLLALTYPQEKVSIFIVDDGSTDNTVEVARTFLTDSRVKYFYKENGGKYSALNLGLEHATSELVGCLDADSFVSPDALTHIVRAFQNIEVMAVTPAIKVYEPRTIIQKIQETEYMLGILFKKLLACINAQYVTPGPFSVYRRSVFETAGTFKHAHQTEDMEMALRMHSKHLRIENALDAEVYTTAPKTVGKILNQRLRWTYGFMKNTSDYRFMLFRKRYGNLGVFSLPFALISLLIVLYTAFYVLWKIGDFLMTKIIEVATVGFLTPLQSIELSWFFVHTETISIIVFLSIFLFIILLSLSVVRVRGGMKLKTSDAYFILLYSLIVPLWTARAVVKLFSWVPVKWR